MHSLYLVIQTVVLAVTMLVTPGDSWGSEAKIYDEGWINARLDNSAWVNGPLAEPMCAPYGGRCEIKGVVTITPLINGRTFSPSDMQYKRYTFDPKVRFGMYTASRGNSKVGHLICQTSWNKSTGRWECSGSNTVYNATTSIWDTLDVAFHDSTKYNFNIDFKPLRLGFGDVRAVDVKFLLEAQLTNTLTGVTTNLTKYYDSLGNKYIGSTTYSATLHFYDVSFNETNKGQKVEFIRLGEALELGEGVGDKGFIAGTKLTCKRISGNIDLIRITDRNFGTEMVCDGRDYHLDSNNYKGKLVIFDVSLRDPNNAYGRETINLQLELTRL